MFLSDVTAGPCVLVVDDDADIRTLLKMVFEQTGFRVITAANGQEGLAAARRTPLAVIVLDLMMPVMDGWEFRQQQRADPRLSNIPVVVTSAYHRLSQQTAGMDAVAVFAKPLDFDALIQAVTAVSRATEMASASVAAPSPPQPASPSTPAPSPAARVRPAAAPSA